MSYTKEQVGGVMDRLKEGCVKAHKMSVAFGKGRGFYHANHGTYIVPVRLIKEELGVGEFAMPVGIRDILTELGWRRETRMIYEHSKSVSSVSCWTYREAE